MDKYVVKEAVSSFPIGTTVTAVQVGPDGLTLPAFAWILSDGEEIIGISPDAFLEGFERVEEQVEVTPVLE
jgi:hypothetical protein